MRHSGLKMVFTPDFVVSIDARPTKSGRTSYPFGTVLTIKLNSMIGAVPTGESIR